jgi:protein-S-isoprenylcysteine O-methyltransferase Ste14
MMELPHYTQPTANALRGFERLRTERPTSRPPAAASASRMFLLLPNGYRLTMENPKAKMWVMFFVSFVVIALALFLAAGTVDYWQGWAYLGVCAVSGILLTLYTVKDPVLLEGRIKAGPMAEKRTAQKIILLCSTIPFVAMFILPPLDHRFGWSDVPLSISVAGNVLILVSMWMVYRVFRENSFGAATVEITSNQRVISTGPYAVVRNPMYSSAAVYCIGLALALGSYWALIASVLTILGLVWRLFDEEKFLSENLPGYKDYCAKVRWHLIPGLF